MQRPVSIRRAMELPRLHDMLDGAEFKDFILHLLGHTQRIEQDEVTVGRAINRHRARQVEDIRDHRKEPRHGPCALDTVSAGEAHQTAGGACRHRREVERGALYLVGAADGDGRLGRGRGDECGHWGSAVIASELCGENDTKGDGDERRRRAS